MDISIRLTMKDIRDRRAAKYRNMQNGIRWCKRYQGLYTIFPFSGAGYISFYSTR